MSDVKLGRRAQRTQLIAEKDKELSALREAAVLAKEALEAYRGAHDCQAVQRRSPYERCGCSWCNDALAALSKLSAALGEKG